MTRSQIEYLLAVDKLRNFSKAADECCVTQSTLSAMVAKFEQVSGIVIFDRKSKPIGVTREGQELLKQLKNIHREFSIMDEVVNQIKGIETGSLSIASIPTVAPYLFPHILDKIALAYPEVNFTIHELTTGKVIEDIQAGKIDIGIVAIPLDIKELIEIPLYKESFLLYDKRGIADENPKQVKVDEIDYEKLLLLEEGHCFSNQVAKFCNLQQVKKVQNAITYYSGSIESLKKMVNINKGLTLLPYLSTLDLPAVELKHIKQFEAPKPARMIGLVYHRNFAKSRLLKGVERIIIENVKPMLKNTDAVKVLSPF